MWMTSCSCRKWARPLEKRIQNAAFIGTTGDERLTLVTCWPYAVDDHRLIVIARPNQ